MTIQANEDIQKDGVQRRAVIKAAAWAAPVIAVAAATPLAAASAGQASVNPFVGSNISVNTTTKTASGSFTASGANITNVVGSWATGTLSGSYKLTGQWATGAITKAGGAAFVLNEVLTSSSGTAWTVSSIVSDEDGVWEVYFTAPSMNVTSDTQITLPAAAYSGTYVTATSRNPISAQVSVGAAAINGGESVASSSSYPA